jgi:hypothetical protein
MAVSAAQLRELQRRIDANPSLRSHLQQQLEGARRMGISDRDIARRTWDPELTAAGIDRPSSDIDYNLLTGQVEQDSFMERNPWVAYPPRLQPSLARALRQR